MLLNPRRSPCLATDRALIGRTHAADAQALLALCPAHRATPLLALPALATRLGVGHVHLKAEWQRMGMSSFKILGGAHAVALRVLAHARARLDRPVSSRELMSTAVRAIAGELTLVCASAGNHGLAVAAGARLFGAHATVCLDATVAEDFAERLRGQGATVLRAGSSYDEAMARATALAARCSWTLVADSSWPGYTEVPLDVMRGYTVLLDEAATALEAHGATATHVFVQAGVGGLAAAAAGYLRDRWGENFRLIVVEPAGAPCLLESARHGQPVRVSGNTSLGRLDCKQPSLLAFELLARLADAFVLVTDVEAEAAAARLARHGAPLSACGAAGAAGLITTCGSDATRRRLGLDAHARVLLIGTEAAYHPTGGPRI